MEGADRVNYSFGMKVNLGGYESADFHISLSSDVRPHESPAQALKRIQQFVSEECEKQYEELKELKK